MSAEGEMYTRLWEACGSAPLQAVRRELRSLLGECDDRPSNALDARIWLAELAWCDGDAPDLAALIADALEAG